ncbi:MAG: 30S ribosomal protein S5 [Pseudomonadota bacterium]
MVEQSTKPSAEQQSSDAITDGLDSRVVDIRRTTKVVKGGRNFSFSATAVVGDRKGKIGYGRGKAKEVSIAVQKATEAARRNMVTIKLNKETLYYPITANHGATKVFMKPAAPGTGIIAGGAMRDVFEVSGVHNVLAKIIGSPNPLNVVLATINGLKSMLTPENIAAKRGKTIAEILGKQHDSE